MSQLIIKTVGWSPARRCLFSSRTITTGNIVGNNHATITKDPTSSTMKTTGSEELKVGDIIHGYKLERIDYIKELNIKPYYLRHQSTGAEHLHVHKDGDSNNVFAVSLRTTPKNSTGVAHILEHLALSGSKKYAVRDPFFKMTTRSLATFMNAMTGPDFTVYPFSTQNQKDFENLLSVYTDAVFFPRLRPVDFRQEGWRLEHETPNNKETPIVLRGVVYNEMKGVFSSSSATYGRQLLNNLFPETTYQYESGGDPEHIPNLSHEELKKFYRNHYHPSNAKFFTYGDIQLENHLRLINEMVLSKFSENSQAREQSLVQEQNLWNKTKVVDITCPPDPMNATPDKQTTTSISYLFPVIITDYHDMFALQMLTTLLTDGQNAPFYKSLIESGLGSDYSPSTGFGSFTKQPWFSVGLQNIHANDVGKVHQIIEDTLKQTAVKGFPAERIEAILHRIELSLKHNTGNFGLRLAMNMEAAWNHDGDIIEYFKVNKYVEKFKKDLASDPGYWSKLIDKYFLKNGHKLILNMNPDPSYEEKRKEREQTILENKISNLSDLDKQTVLYEGMELMKIQDTKDDVSTLPCLDPSKDISRDLSHHTKLDFESHKGVKIQHCEQPTNEVVYFRAMTDIGEKLKAAGLIDYLPLFCDVATKLGAGAYNRQQFAQRSLLTTGGLGVSMMITPSLSEFDKYSHEVFFGSHCLRRNVDNMFELWTSVFNQIHFQDNKDYLHQLIKGAAADLSEGISYHGKLYAVKRSASTLSDISSLDEQLSGLSFIARMKDMASKESIESIASKLQKISQIALDPHNMKCALNAESGAMQTTSTRLKEFIDVVQGIHASKQAPADDVSDKPYEQTKVDEMKFPFATHFVAKSLITVPRLHKDFAKLVIMSKLISSRFLLTEIREKGGAYGAGAVLSNTGILSFFSYRDPNTERTLNTFDRSSQWLIEGKEYTEKDVEESKLGVFQGIDRPVAPAERGLNFFTMGETDEMRQEYRRRLLDVSMDDVKQVARKYLSQENYGTHII